MGAGKTSIGRRVAKALGVGFFDTDIAVVRAHGPIEAIFAEHGEASFPGPRAGGRHAGARHRRCGLARRRRRPRPADAGRPRRAPGRAADGRREGRRRPHPRAPTARCCRRRMPSRGGARSPKRVARSTSDSPTRRSTRRTDRCSTSSRRSSPGPKRIQRNAHERCDHDRGERRRRLRHHGGTRHPVVPRRSPPARGPQGARRSTRRRSPRRRRRCAPRSPAIARCCWPRSPTPSRASASRSPPSAGR